jgi:hypothetical protein
VLGALVCLVVAGTTLGATTLAHAQTATESAGTGRVTEEPDPTRLDVERLPHEAIRITRDLYAHGFFLEVSVGGRGYIGGVGRIATPGPFASIGFGYEIFEWLLVRTFGEVSIHQTSAPAPPSTTVFEILSALGELKLQANPTAEFALWLAGQVGITVATSDVLRLYGLRNAATVGFAWGGDVGIDLHFHSRHHSLGLHGGVRGAPSLDGFDGETAVGVHGAAYLRYVF